ncbi:MAG: hypothetical protein FJZ01_26460 [Candidatus Sericytochromatia bacterium]|nr:hypothetical protein [Candidatus Tanganyikabacteria bacterium]
MTGPAAGWLLGAGLACAALGCQVPLGGTPGQVFVAEAGGTGGLAVRLQAGRQVQALDGVVEKVAFSLTGTRVPGTPSIEVPRARFSGGKAVVEFGGLLAGSVRVTALLFDSDNLRLGSATADATIAPDRLTQLALIVAADFASASFSVDTENLVPPPSSLSVAFEPISPRAWQPAAPMAVDRAAFSAVPIGAAIWAVGGDPGDQLERYDPASGRWTPFQISNSNKVRRPIGSAAALRNKIVVVGRDIEVGQNETAAPFFFDPEGLDAFSHLEPAPFGVLPSSLGDVKEYRAAVGVAAADDRLYMVGGAGKRAVGTNQVFVNFPTLEVLSAQTAHWSELAAMPTARGAPGAVILSRKLYVAGGSRWTGTTATDPVQGRLTGVTHTTAVLAATDSFEVYDIATDRWTALAALPAARYGLALVASGGRLYAIGGADSNGAATTRVDSFDPATGAWRAEPPLLEPRAFLAAAALPGGKLLAAGGFGADKRARRSAEIFNTGGAQ